MDLNGQVLQVLVHRTVTHQYLILTGLDTHGIGLAIPALKTLATERDCLRNGLSSLYVDTLEGTQRLQRSLLIGGVADIHLNNLRTVALASVLDRKVDGNVIAIDSTTGLSHLESRIAQSIAEGEQGIVEVTIGTSLQRVVLVVGQLLSTLIECEGQLTAGIDIAEEYVSYSRATLLTRIPSLYDGVTCLHLWLQSDS